MKIERVKQKTVVEQVMDQIKGLIASGQFKPHDKIPTENELAESFGIGRSSIREAIKIFQYLGILESHTRKGTFVCDYTNISTEALTWSILLGKNEIFELVDLRNVIESRALVLLIRRFKKNPESVADVINTLEGEIGKMQEAIDGTQMESLIEADYNFHGTIIVSSENNVFINIYHTLRSFMHEEIKKTNIYDSERSSLVEEHRAILTALKSGDEDNTIAMHKNHINNINKQLKQAMESSTP
jgi:DNA-binding FadR family transcriptional regulator